MNWFGPTGDCGCGCNGPCPACDTFISVVISGIGNSCTTCQGLAGTYVVRAYGGGWTNCSVNINALDAFGQPACSGIFVTGAGAPGSSRIIVNLYQIGSNVKCDIILIVKYTDSVGVPTMRSEYTTTFSATVANCAALVGATFSFVSGVETSGFGATPGDHCGMNSATVTLST
jgi:hypothetical protein